jgi:hypothetical protein
MEVYCGDLWKIPHTAIAKSALVAVYAAGAGAQATPAKPIFQGFGPARQLTCFQQIQIPRTENRE